MDYIELIEEVREELLQVVNQRCDDMIQIYGVGAQSGRKGAGLLYTACAGYSKAAGAGESGKGTAGNCYGRGTLSDRAAYRTVPACHLFAGQILSGRFKERSGRYQNEYCVWLVAALQRLI